ncbi:MAG: competence protein ComEA [Chloroflexota bacterium]|nr:competence protein ComEA [Chloroflexota bacterium]
MQKWLVGVGVPILAAVAVAGSLLGILALRSPAPTIEVRPRDPVPTEVPTMYVHVDGAVAAPGVYALAGGARVFDAVDAAGGATDDADVTQLNLAARVSDGQKLVIPSQRPAVTTAQPEGADAKLEPTDATSRINVNTASQRVLESLPGIGPVTAGRVIQYRQANGPFTRIEQLRDARLVNAATFERIKSLIAVE